MMKKPTLFGNLIDIGVKSEMEFYQKREARIVNLFALITICGLLIGVTTVFFISGQYPTFIVTSTFIPHFLFWFLMQSKSIIWQPIYLSFQ